MTEIKKCEDCKFIILGDHPDRFSQVDLAKCSSPNVEGSGYARARYHLGENTIVREHMFCENARLYESKCGKEAKYFEPTESRR